MYYVTPYFVLQVGQFISTRTSLSLLSPLLSPSHPLFHPIFLSSFIFPFIILLHKGISRFTDQPFPPRLLREKVIFHHKLVFNLNLFDVNTFLLSYEIVNYWYQRFIY